MAIKIMNVPKSRSNTQDFVMINNPVFFVRNASDYVAFQSATNPLRFFLPGWNPFRFRVHEFFAANGITRRVVSNPLNAQYYSMTPYLLGDQACKFSCRPVGDPSPFVNRSSVNFLHDNLVAALASRDASFEFCVQLRSDAASMPIEDPTIARSEQSSPFIPVAHLTIGTQVFDTPERVAFGEALSFTPWHGLDAHRPLGGINRVRRVVYETISALRHNLNHVPRVEPEHDMSAPPAIFSIQERNMSSFIDGVFSIVGGAIDQWGWADRTATKLVINALVASAPTRPHPWSTASDYTSWKSLTDKTYQARQLPAADLVTVPAVDAVAALFKRPDGQQRMSDKSTCLFPAFAQYLIDGFIRTQSNPRDTARTTSNHEIDLCPLYGLNEKQTLALRLLDSTQGQRGRLQSQIINGEEWSPYYYLRDGTGPDSKFQALDTPLGLTGVSVARQMTLFAIGGDRANSTPFTAMMNTLLLREHNRVAGELERQNPGWDDERVFQTARNIMIPMFIKIVIEQYINHITPAPFNLVADPSVAWTANWNRPNWMTAEFSLLYRWHSLMPDDIKWPTRAIPIALGEFLLDNSPLIEAGLARAFLGAASQSSAELGAFNTGAALQIIELSAIQQGRNNRLASYNSYRAAYGMAQAQDSSDISSNPKVVELLKALYGDVNKVEFYPGLFAEDRVDKSPLPSLLMKMVGVDAFSQALTNPLLSEHVFNAATFTQWGLDLITQTHSLGVRFQ
jgi:prostaglandin-endoperoxide synthase 2